MKKEKVLEIRKSKGECRVVFCNIEKFKGISGVWVMYNEKGILLEVAQTSNIFEELDFDLAWIIKKYPQKSYSEKRYAARRLFDFNKRFDVLKCDKNRTTAKYRNIAEESERIYVYVILENEAVSNNRYEREKIELEIAINSQAIYWNAYGKQRRKAKEYYASLN
jgi:hypothetical protein